LNKDSNEMPNVNVITYMAVFQAKRRTDIWNVKQNYYSKFNDRSVKSQAKFISVEYTN